MSEDLRASIESFLLEYPPDRWVPIRLLVERFNLGDERYCRAEGKVPGLITRFVITSSKGVKHLRNATAMERIVFKNKNRRVLIAAIRRERWHQEDVAAVMDGRFEKFTGQGKLL